MAHRLELIVFDWDGTLMDSTAAIAQAIQAAAQDLGLAAPSDAAARHVIGLGLNDALAQAVPDLPPQRYGDMAQRYRHHYLSNSQSLQLFEGIPELLRELKTRGHFLAIATGKSRRGLNEVLARSGLHSLMDATRCADECFPKPHPQMLKELLDELGVSPEAAVMIGDTTHDLQMAKNAGVVAVAVSYGAHEAAVLVAEQPNAHCNTVEELRRWLCKNA
ncbi:putative phosphoglycolate phosphatase, clustered with ribosomal large subunit pseudouridine synthase C [Georgfuchsia toluolica]|uniref:Phosphoglycolate phosphatase, clustered with ribosomal large subunit pseudouridine synthase C n=1 Tax=Georgfuchsia toluolica TaxID=424218 RepID=A0A916NHH2_9PROT|nr:HAD-IA family hydrolase [Georgfuchsia toluolica]CAG4883346.1 putative phosphoglycolate phosphatase, clustered with ribosomal large subunit pseudouridine synthase C [Georgfuchsia toluolica]